MKKLRPRRGSASQLAGSRAVDPILSWGLLPTPGFPEGHGQTHRRRAGSLGLWGLVPSSTPVPDLAFQACCSLSLVAVRTSTSVRVRACVCARVSAGTRHLRASRAGPPRGVPLGSRRGAFLAPHATLPALSGACLCWTGTNGGRFTQAGLMKALETPTGVAAAARAPAREGSASPGAAAAAPRPVKPSVLLVPSAAFWVSTLAE